MSDFYSDEELIHYGTPMKSGRYPWGSGKEPYQNTADFLARINDLKKQGYSETKIANDIFEISSTNLRTQQSLATNERKMADIAQIKRLREKGYSYPYIADKMGFKNESTVRSMLKAGENGKIKEAKDTADFLKSQVDKKGMIDVGNGVERELNISKERMNQSLYILEREGYPTYGGSVPQVTNPGKQTNLKILCPPGTEHKEIYNHEKIHSVREYTSQDDGHTFHTLQRPSSFDSKRLGIRYSEDGGTNKDGVVEIRRNVKDLDLGKSQYAQVRIMVDGTHYIKGMAVYSDDLPKGVDLMFNTNKSKDVSKMDVLKPIKEDPDNPFGALIKDNGQSYYTDSKGNQKLSPINKTREEGDWDKWTDSLPAQMLSKQNLSSINAQLNESVKQKQSELDEINRLTNPVVKQVMLQKFADGADKAAVELKAASLPRQKYKVLLPVEELKDTEVYAPTFQNGEKLALIRYPHGGTFEIPVLTVNNNNKAAQKFMKNAADAIGINSKVAERLSGADFDGDAVTAIPTGKTIKITSTPPLKQLEGFDPKMEYAQVPGMKIMSKHNTQKQMGIISNLITDMSVGTQKASQEELARAVKHSMVVIDAEKHKLNYKQSEIDNNIASLKKKYQKHVLPDGTVKYGGVNTLISKAKSEQQVPKRQGNPDIDPKTGKLIYKTADPDKLYYTNSKGQTVMRTQKSTKMMETDDARTLSSGSPREEAYAKYANSMKAMANKARLSMINTELNKYSPTAKKLFNDEVESLDRKLKIAESNAPKERAAQLKATTVVNKKLESLEDKPSKGDIKKMNQKALTQARIDVGAKRSPIQVTPREWDAIQSGAISSSKLRKIINHIDDDKLKELATPKANKSITPTKKNRIRTLMISGSSISDIAAATGLSVSTITRQISEFKEVNV